MIHRPFLLGNGLFVYPGYFAVMIFGRAYVFLSGGKMTFRKWDNIWRRESMQ